VISDSLVQIYHFASLVLSVGFSANQLMKTGITELHAIALLMLSKISEFKAPIT